MPKNVRAVVFDLDGTLVDSLDDITESMNHALATVGRAGYDASTYRRWVGDGLHALALRALPDADARTFEAAVRAYREHYRDHMAVHTRPYPGIPGLLGELVARSVRCAVLSNKPHEATLRLVARLFPDGTFDDVRGHEPGAKEKPDPDSTRALLARLGVAADEALFVGDTEVDVRTASAAGVPMVAVTWGFRTEDELRRAGASVVIHRAEELLALLERP